MNEIRAFWILGSRLALAWIFTWIWKSLIKTLMPFNIPGLCIFVLCLAYTFQIDASDYNPPKPNKNPSKLDTKPRESEKEYPEFDKKPPEIEENPVESGKKHSETETKPHKSVPPSIPDNETSHSTSDCAQQEVPTRLTKVKQILNNLEELLQAHGELIEWSGTICADTLTHSYEMQKDQLRQYNDFRNQDVDQFGSVVDVPEGHGKGIPETSRVATERNTSLCDIIGQYREAVEYDHKAVQRHVDTLSRTLKAQDVVVTQTRQLVDESDKSNRDVFHTQRRLIDHNQRLIREHGISIDNVVTNQAGLVAEYQKELDGLALFITANRIFTLIHATPKWKSLGDHTRRVSVAQNGARDTQHLPKDHKKLIKKPQLGIASANVVNNVQQIARTFRNTSQDVIKDMHEKPKVTSRKAWPLAQGSNPKKVEYPYWDLGARGGMDQPMASVFGQLGGTLQGTIQTTVGARHAEITEQLRQGQEDMEMLRANIRGIQQIQRRLREEQERRERLRKTRLEVEAFREKLAQQDVGRQTQRDRVFRVEAEWHESEEASQDSVEEDAIASATITTDASGFTQRDAITAATITEPTDVTYANDMPTAIPTNNEDTGALDGSDHEADAALDDDNDETLAEDDGEGLLPGDLPGRLLARDGWPDKKKPQHKTRKMMQALATRRAEQRAAQEVKE